MSENHWERVRGVLEEALEREPHRRAAYLDQVCADEPEIRREVESLIAREDAIAGELAEPAVPFAATPIASVARTRTTSERIAPTARPHLSRVASPRTMARSMSIVEIQSRAIDDATPLLASPLVF